MKYQNVDCEKVVLLLGNTNYQIKFHMHCVSTSKADGRSLWGSVGHFSNGKIAEQVTNGRRHPLLPGFRERFLVFWVGNTNTQISYATHPWDPAVMSYSTTHCIKMHKHCTKSINNKGCLFINQLLSGASFHLLTTWIISTLNEPEKFNSKIRV